MDPWRNNGLITKNGHLIVDIGILMSETMFLFLEVTYLHNKIYIL